MSSLESSAFKSVNILNSQWNQQNQSPNGVRPPVPQLTNFTGDYSALPSAMPSTLVEPNPKLSNNLVRISSPRDPYAVEYLVNEYGGMSTRFGTNMGR